MESIKKDSEKPITISFEASTEKAGRFKSEEALRSKEKIFSVIEYQQNSMGRSLENLDITKLRWGGDDIAQILGYIPESYGHSQIDPTEKLVKDSLSEIQPKIKKYIESKYVSSKPEKKKLLETAKVLFEQRAPAEVVQKSVALRESFEDTGNTFRDGLRAEDYKREALLEEIKENVQKVDKNSREFLRNLPGKEIGKGIAALSYVDSMRKIESILENMRPKVQKDMRNIYIKLNGTDDSIKKYLENYISATIVEKEI